jgi:S-DNA-T family DNA segregation ATPase FtsK/SpoIIIE
MIKYDFYIDLLAQTHLLIAGATGSGKSVIVNGMLYTALLDNPYKYQFILIDPKRVELSIYKNVPHTIYYASEPDTMIKALQIAMNITEQRYKAMQAQQTRKYTGSKVLVVIDELADLMTTNKRQVKPLLQRLCQIGRAANICVIACTQCPLREIIDTSIKVNFDSRIALRTSCKQDSRNIIGVPGCENLPKYGQCYYKTAVGLTRWLVPYYNDNTILELVHMWESKRKLVKKKKRFLFW